MPRGDRVSPPPAATAAAHVGSTTGFVDRRRPSAVVAAAVGVGWDSQMPEALALGPAAVPVDRVPILPTAGVPPAAACSASAVVGYPDALMAEVFVAGGSLLPVASFSPSPSLLAATVVPPAAAVGGSAQLSSCSPLMPDLLMLEAPPVPLPGLSSGEAAPVCPPPVGSFAAFQQPPILSSNFAPRHAPAPAPSAFLTAKAAPLMANPQGPPSSQTPPHPTPPNAWTEHHFRPLVVQEPPAAFKVSPNMVRMDRTSVIAKL